MVLAAGTDAAVTTVQPQINSTGPSKMFMLLKKMEQVILHHSIFAVDAVSTVTLYSFIMEHIRKY